MWQSDTLKIHPLRFLLFLSFALMLPLQCWAGEWPQILGPNRNGHAQDETLLASWPKAGPKIVWKKPVGAGLAGVAVDKETLVVFHRRDKFQIVEAVNPQTGKRIWSKSFPTDYISSISSDDGPRSVPLIHKGFVYLVSAGGELFCLSLKDGAKSWFRSLAKEYKAPEGYFGIGTSPIIEDDKLILNIGGKRVGIVALSLKDGKTAWESTKEQASYSSPIATTIDKTRHLIFVTRMNTVSLNPKDGKVRFQFAFGKRGPTVNGASPLMVDGKLFLSASYGIGAMMMSIGKDSAKTIWEKQDCMSSQYTTSIYHQGYLYGVHGRADGGTVEFRCIDPKDGKAVWEKKEFGMATLLLADNKIIATKTNGSIKLIAPSSKGYRELASAKIVTPTVRALPAISNGLLYIRNNKTLYAIQVGKTKSGN